MSSLRRLVPALLILVALPSLASAKEPLSLPYVKTTYCVQLRYEMWRNGSAYWSTEYETSDYGDALLMHDLFEIAIENGAICELMDCSFDWIINDVRIVTKREYLQPLPRLPYKDLMIRRLP